MMSEVTQRFSVHSPQIQVNSADGVHPSGGKKEVMTSQESGHLYVLE
jgi:hypothetical protein